MENNRNFDLKRALELDHGHSKAQFEHGLDINERCELLEDLEILRADPQNEDGVKMELLRGLSCYFLVSSFFCFVVVKNRLNNLIYGTTFYSKKVYAVFRFAI